MTAQRTKRGLKATAKPAGSDKHSVRAIAFHLPQFHPIPENDEWWGKGFTEWTNVVKAKPRFSGHYQPHLPADLGFYDLRLRETRLAQAALAKKHGIHGFCYYHYWFNGRRILERPVNEILQSGEPDLPFCLCWANENWTRRWDGQNRRVLLKQEYSAADDLAHIKSLIPAFKDSRYIKIEGKPVFLVYRMSNLPDPAATILRWRREAEAAGLPGLHICCVESFSSEHGIVDQVAADAAVEFAPDGSQGLRRMGLGRRLPFFQRKLKPGVWTENFIWDYSDLAESMLRKAEPDYVRYPCVTPMWDNSSRRKVGANIWLNSTPQRYERWLEKVVHRQMQHPESERLVFINAWNEWGEGNHLEPCQRWGNAYLEATLRALRPS